MKAATTILLCTILAPFMIAYMICERIYHMLRNHHFPRRVWSFITEVRDEILFPTGRNSQ